MSDVSNVVRPITIDAELAPRKKSFAVDETYWGYIIRNTEGPKIGTVVLQAASMFFGAAFVAAGLGLLLLPEVLAGAVDLTIRAMAAVIFFGLAAYLLWFASRGTESELQIDTSLGEVREVVRNRAGRSTLIGRYGFDSIGGVFLDRANAPRNQAVLVLRYRNTAQTLPVVGGRIDALEPLRDRLGRDMMMDAVPRRAEKTIVPTAL
ncbi:hypothetical protein AB3Y40_05945 [Yoonia sp. R2331]|uniref:hypothetical protein n=1 Tax=Yoonia sp. R2331 TaxID=3237238 RepID=UPI0034E3A464